ncbi:MAG: DUF1722 domain-containing protein [Pseudomonadota bacterium]
MPEPTGASPARAPGAEIPARPEPPLPIAISDCLTGAEVRFDGGHKRSSFPYASFNDLFTYRGLCPEMAAGLGVPRVTLQLVGSAEAPRVIENSDERRDLTERIASQADAVRDQLDDVVGYVFMKNSPSCGLFRVKVYPDSGIPLPESRGVYAARVAELFPALPLEECGRLKDPLLAENFVTRVFAFAHFKALLADGLTAARLIAFHSRYKYLLMAHSVSAYREAGKLLSNLKGDLDALAGRYLTLLMDGVSRPASRGGNANVLQHLQGYVKHALDGRDRQELAASIDDYRRGDLPLLAPLTLLRHHLQRHATDYALQQFYLEPHPAATLRRPL